MDRNQHRIIAAEILAAATAIAEKHGYVAKLGRGLFDPNAGGIFKLELAPVVGGVALDRNAQDFKMLAPLLGLNATDLGRAFKYGAETYKVVGVKSRASKNPVLCERTDGKVFKFSEHVVKQLLAAAAA